MSLIRICKNFGALYVAWMCLSAPLYAQTLFMEDFQDGDANGWRSGGDGTVQVTVYQGNYSLRLTKRASAIIALGVDGPAAVTISMAFAALDLEGRDACVAEASNDNAASWIEINRVEDGGDDGFSLHVGERTMAAPAAGAPLMLRLRVEGNGDNDTCWADNIRIVAAPRQSSLDQAGPRQALTAGFLLGGDPMPAPVSMRAFAPDSAAQHAGARFEGKLSFRIEPRQGGMDVVRDNFNFMAGALTGLGHPPDFEMAFVQSGEALIPARRGLVRTDNQAWDIFIEPGKVWREPDDRGFMRAAIPFALQERNANCTHNGVLTFLFDEEGATSRAAYQIASETCYYFQFDMWGVAQTRYAPLAVPDANEIITAYKEELAGKLAVKPIGELNLDHPALDPVAFAAPGDVSPEHLTTYGVLFDGVHYRGGCSTRYGPYPFCENIALPSYSTSKSLFAGLGLMRLEMLYPGAMNEMISDYAPQCAAAGWRDVTFGHALDMATGRYNSTAPEADENNAVQDGFFIDLTHAEKVDRACTLYPRKSDPGKQWVYHTSDHYILGTAMQAYLRRRLGDNADIYRDLLVDPVWKALGLSPVAFTTRRTRDDVLQPFVGWGLTFLPDDLAKLAAFVALDRGAHQDAQLVDADQLAAALQTKKSDPGLQATDENFRYNNGFWAWNAAGVLGCETPSWIPFMSGFGGVSVVLMPNGVIYYYVSDNQEFAWSRALQAANLYDNMCKGE